ncbi:outer membrane beta-barrel protein [Legionella sp. CNM-1927-20]|uniref:outer membrane beta-barrel protein n=1 Tax=Legionella sp. CNM-1927-20 TaxID=3422221 RepID=UPI00403AD1CB
MALLSSIAQAEIASPSNTIYLGLSAGYGSTTWEGLVPSEKNKNGAMTISTPIRVQEGGGMWGVFSGYEFNPYFAIESHYRHYPSAHVKFDKDSLFAFNHDTTHFISHTEVTGLIGKVMLIIPNTQIKVYSGAGAAIIHRYDKINNDRRITPTFDMGFNIQLSRHFMLGFNGNYTAGYGESEIDPAKDYFPFLYSIFMNLTYRI